MRHITTSTVVALLGDAMAHGRRVDLCALPREYQSSTLAPLASWCVECAKERATAPWNLQLRLLKERLDKAEGQSSTSHTGSTSALGTTKRQHQSQSRVTYSATAPSTGSRVRHGVSQVIILIHVCE